MAFRKRDIEDSDIEKHVRAWYNSEVKVSPAIMAYKLGVPLRHLVNIMSRLNIRKKRQHDEDF
jgi:hypothetical protein